MKLLLSLILIVAALPATNQVAEGQAVGPALNGNKSALKPNVKASAQTLRYDDGVIAIKGIWGYTNSEGYRIVQAWIKSLAQVNDDESPEPFNYFYYSSSDEVIFEGTLESWYPNSKRESSVSYLHGIKNGSFRRWYYYGNKEVEGNFVNGVAVGKWNIYYPNGVLFATMNFDTISVPDKLFDEPEKGTSATFNRTEAMNHAIAEGFPYPSRWLGPHVQIHGPAVAPFVQLHGRVIVLREGGDTSSVQEFWHGQRTGKWSVWEFSKKKVVIEYSNDSVTAFYDKLGHNILRDTTYSDYFDFSRLFYKEDELIDSTGPELVYPTNYWSLNTNFARCSFPGDFERMQSFLDSNLRMPPENLKVKKKSSVNVEFIVHSDGSRSDVRVIKGLGYGCDEEALRLVNAMPRWEPARYQGKNVAMRTWIMISFRKGI